MLHVTNGDSAAEKLREAGMQGAVLPWRDILHEGPVPAGIDEANLREVRVRYLAEHGWAGEERVRADLEERDARLAQAIIGHDEIVLWFESDLYDMLQLAQVLDRLPPDVASLVIAGEEEFTGVAELTEDEMRDVFKGRDVAGKARRVAVTEALVREGRAVWRALRNPEPARLAALVDGTPDLPVLGQAIERLLQQFPWCRSHLNRTERALLKAVDDGAETPLEAFEAHQRQEERPFMGDTTALAYVRAMRQEPGALLTNRRPFTLTDEGRAVLHGQAQWRNRPERWLGGVQLPPGKPRWCWDPTQAKLV
jgi:Domain of unknown function (DUF1835)